MHFEPHKGPLRLIPVRFDRPEDQMIDAPAECVKCGMRAESPTTGKLMNVCYCGGELKTIIAKGVHRVVLPRGSADFRQT